MTLLWDILGMYLLQFLLHGTSIVTNSAFCGKFVEEKQKILKDKDTFFLHKGSQS